MLLAVRSTAGQSLSRAIESSGPSVQIIRYVRIIAPNLSNTTPFERALGRPGRHCGDVPSPQNRRTVRRGRLIVTIAATCAAVIAPMLVSVSPGASVTPAVASVTPVPRDRLLPAAIDLQPQYQGQSICNPPPKPGVTLLADLLKTTYGPHAMYSSRACKDDPSSEHTEGRALDWMVTGRIPSDKAKAEAFLNWLLAPGADGTKAAMARRMGIMYIGWNNQIWRGYNKVGWGELKGCFAKAKAGTNYDTYCHRDHIHFSLTWDGAAALTSYWDGSAQTTPPCPTGRVTGKKPGLPAGRRTVQLPTAKSALNTTTGTGNGKRVCRIQEPRWSGDAQRLDAKVVGKAGVPADAVRVLVRATAIGPNAPMAISVWGTGRKKPSAATLTTLQNANASAERWVRPGSKGYVSVATNTGDTHIRLQTLAYQVPN